MSGRQGRHLEDCVEGARRRLARNEFLRRLSLGVAASAALLLVLSIGAAGGSGSVWLPWIGQFLCLVSLGSGVAYALRARISISEAAIFIDRRSGDGDLIASALGARDGPLRHGLRERAEESCRSIEVRRLARFRPSWIGKAIPVLLVLCLSVRVASGGTGDVQATGPRAGSMASPAATARSLLSRLMRIDQDESATRDHTDELRQVYDDLQQMRVLYRELLAEIEAEPMMSAAAEGRKIRAGDLAPAEREAIRKIIRKAASQLPRGGESSSAASRALEALGDRVDGEFENALRTLIDSLRRESGDGLDELSSEIRRVAAKSGVSLQLSVTPLDRENGRIGPLSGNALERAMDREDVPRKYRDSVRRYFDRRGETSK
ncbi:MAG: hypothetical protein O7H41_02905 [Planctomycetota bacterium]|nr:hypothetical protein [Planctomycetota bacterium]